VVLEEPVRFILAVRDLQGVCELRLILARLQVPLDAADSGQQEQNADHDTEGGGGEDETGGPRRVRGGVHLINAPVDLFLRKQLIKGGTDGLIGGRQPGGESRGRVKGHVHRAEEVTDRDPLTDKLLEVTVFMPRIVGVEPLDVGELSVNRGKHTGIERAEEL
jgi:hypothetical protein